MLNLEGYQAAPIDESELTVEDRWMMSRLASVAQSVTQEFEQYHFAEAARELYDFAWDQFCSFYVEMLKDRLSDPQKRPHAQRMLAYALDCLLRLLHPVMPFITEEIWQNLARLCPTRGWEQPQTPTEVVAIAPWPELDGRWVDAEIEGQFALYQSALGALREIRASQNIGNKRRIEFQVRCEPEVAAALAPLSGYFSRMAAAELTTMGPEIVPPETHAIMARTDFEIVVNLEGLIDIAAEIKRLEKEQANLQKSIQSKQRQLGNEKFVAAKPDLAAEIRESLTQVEEQLETVSEALQRYRAKSS